MEHVVLQRLQNYLEDTDRIPHTMFGFRPKLSTQDILLQLKKEIFETASKNAPKAILALDLKGAFDNVAHTAILRNLASLDCGERTYGYVRDFLTARQAILKVGDLQSNPHKYGSRGTPQGAVLSPMLFNIAMINLPQKLGSIPDIKHGLYADDITIWIAKGSEGEMQERLQQAADTVHTYAKECGLACAPQKSELLLVQKRRHDLSTSFYIMMDGIRIEPTDHIKILGMTYQEDCKNTRLLQKLDSSTAQITRMIRRVSTQKYGMKEQDTIKLVQAFIISRLAYVTPYTILQAADKQKLNTLIRKAYKQALALPPTTSTERLAALGIHNTIEEIVEAHLTAQQVRLGLTSTGRSVLTSLKLNALTETEDAAIVPLEIRTRLKLHPLPRNMHPEHHQA